MALPTGPGPMQYITLSKSYTINEVYRGTKQTGSTG